ncbi:MAG: SGNH/GDSL hydrolase family protein [Deltaproteobacteria bacterium]
MRQRIILTLALVLLIGYFRGELCAGVADTEGDYYQDDGIVGHVHRPHARREYDWPEYKKGNIVLRTNNLGFRQDTDTEADKAKGVIRILVAGDSQIDGVVNNSESFPSVLESRLNSQNQPAKFEIINGATGYYGPDHYFLFLYKYLFLKPDVYIVVVYTGNDFLDAARILEARDGMIKRPADYLSSLRNCSRNDGAINQVMNQVYYFKTFAWMREKTVNHVLDRILKINELCKQHKISLLVAFLPTKADVEWQSDEEVLTKTKDCLKLSEPDLRINRELTESLIKGVSDKNINFIDLYEVMKNQNEEFFWKKDYHLNDRGHSFIAEKINEKYYSLFH